MTQRFDSIPDLAAWLRERVIGDVHGDSRCVKVGDGFVAWPGAVNDARRFVDAALKGGAAAVVVEDNGLDAWGPWDDRVASLPQLKQRAGELASAFYNHPTQAMDVVAVTGTNGKTSTAWWFAQLMNVLHRPCAVVGTLGLGTPKTSPGQWDWLPTGLTTPDPVVLQGQCAQWLHRGVKTCAIEASSIGLVESRLNATRIRVAVFTNFTQDHLDFHGDMQRYWAAKASLFDWPGLQVAVVNVDDPKGVELAEAWSDRLSDLWCVSLEEKPAVQPRLHAQHIEPHVRGQRFTLTEYSSLGAILGQWAVDCPLVGRYNVANLLGVWAAARALGVSMDAAVRASALLTAVPGRLQPVQTDAKTEPLVLVDYAHTPDAVEHVLRAARDIAQQRAGAVWVVLGCGGDRDRGKRPLMAAAAEKFADRVVLTSDNPRSEEPASILQDMSEGLSVRSAVVIEINRAHAIALAIQAANECDVIVVAGKGHETYQEVAGMRHPFSDAGEVLLALKQRAHTQGVDA